MDFLLINLGLKQQVDSLSEGRNSESSETTDEVEIEVATEEMLCEDAQKDVSVVKGGCQEIEAATMDETIRMMREELLLDLNALKDKMKKCREAEVKYAEAIHDPQKHVLPTEEQIQAELNKLYLFLEEEGESRLAALREEEEPKRKIMVDEVEQFQGEESSVFGSIATIKEDMQMDSVANQCTLSDPQMMTGALIDVAKHLGRLSFSVWMKMKDHLNDTVQDVDPNTESDSK